MFVVDVTATWQRKLRAIGAYRSQFGPAAPTRTTALADPAFLDVLEAKGRYFGAMIGVARGEPFTCAGPLAMTSLPGLGGDPPARFPYVLQ
jgi:LmbE family N-acetylglucosaminyl deacetylase